MVQAYILVQTEVGKAAAVAAEIAGITGVISAEDVTGPYDVIVRAEAEDVDQLGQLVVARVQGVGGITRTLTCPVVHLGLSRGATVRPAVGRDRRHAAAAARRRGGGDRDRGPAARGPTCRPPDTGPLAVATVDAPAAASPACATLLARSRRRPARGHRHAAPPPARRARARPGCAPGRPIPCPSCCGAGCPGPPS